MTELKPCPFCGGEGALDVDLMFPPKAFIECTSCRCAVEVVRPSPKVSFAQLLSTACDEWNRRAPHEQKE